MNVSVQNTSLSSSIFFFEESTLVMFHMVEMSFLLTVIWLHLYAFVNANYCVPPDDSEYASIRFCQSGTVSSLHIFINGSSILTKESLIGKECVCRVVWSGNGSLVVNGLNSCNRCGLDVTFLDFLLSSTTGVSDGWGITQLDNKSFPIAMKINTKITLENIYPEFCLILQGNGGNDINVTLTCEELNMPTTVSTTRGDENATSTKTPTTVSSELPISFTEGPSGKTSTKTPTTVSSELPISFTEGPSRKTSTKTPTTVSSELPISLTNGPSEKTSTKTPTTVSSELPTSLTKGPSGTEQIITTHQTSNHHTENITAITVLPGLTMTKSASNINEVVIPAAAGGGTGMLIILVIIIVACCLRKKKQRAEKSIFMSEVDVPDAIMTDNPAYGNSVDAHNNAVPHSVAQCTEDVYAVVNKEGNSKVLPSSEVHHMKVGDTGDIYALVNKENGQEIPNREHSNWKSFESHAQTRINQNNDTLCIAPSTDYIDIAINTTDQSNL